MRKLVALVPLAAAVASLVACSGGGGGTASAPATQTPPSGSGSVPASQYVTPTFTITIPARGASKARKPQFVSSATLSVKIALTADSNGVDPTTLANNPMTTNVNGTSGISCTSGCTVSGPPVPPGTDTFVVTTYDEANAAGNALDTTPTGGVTPPSIRVGTSPSVTITLLGIPNGFALNTTPTGAAGTSSDTTFGPASGSAVTLNVVDADQETITGTYANPVTVSTTETNGDGVYIASTCPAYPTGNSAQTGSSVSLLTSSDSTHFCYGGIAENPVPFAVKAAGAFPLTGTFSPVLAAPAYVAGSGAPPETVITSGPEPDVSLFTPTGDGSTGSLNYSETGFTNDPYDQVLTASPGTCTTAGPFSTYATLSATGVTGATGSTQFTVTAIANPAPGICPVSVGDGLTLNSTDAPATFGTSYSASSIGVHARGRAKNR